MDPWMARVWSIAVLGLTLCVHGSALPAPQARTITVTRTEASGAGSLHEAIRQANGAVGATAIEFRLSESDPGYRAAEGTWTLRLAEPLPLMVRGKITIDGLSQPAAAGGRDRAGPRIVIAADHKGIEAAFMVASAGNILRGLAIGGFKCGILLLGGAAAGNRVEDCYVGLVPPGDVPLPNESGIVVLEGANGNVLARNVVSGNTSIGVFLGGRGTTGNVLRGNRIGTDPSGARRVPNEIGVMIARGSRNVIGGGGEGDGNVISGNEDIGVLLVGKWTGQNVVQGNRIGVDAGGTVGVHNNIGIVIKSLANGNRIGGPSPRERNVISGNLEIGVYIEAADGNQVLGNFIGTDVTGMKGVREGDLVQGNGIEFNTVAQDNVLGGLEPGERNVISGNKVYGVVYYGHCTRNSTVGNYIGTDATGNAPLANATGICVDCASHRNDIAGNVISGNTSYGMFFVTRGTEHNRLRGNRIGTNAEGTAAVPNDIGLVISTGAARNIVGGEAPEDRNVISGNAQSGLMITNRFTEGNQIVGNYVGVDASGRKRLPNRHGILFSTYPKGNLVRNNVISGNGSSGIILYEYAEGNRILGNRIGTDPSGTLDLGNQAGGIVLDQQAKGNVIGASGEGNTVANNAFGGIIEKEQAGGGNTFTDNAFSGNRGPEIVRLRPDRHPANPVGTGADVPPPLPEEMEQEPEPPPGAGAAPVGDGSRTAVTVTHTGDSGRGSLREALEFANRNGGRVRILFDLPRSDPGFDARSGTWTIVYRDTPPPLGVPDVVIDGSSQTRRQGDTNPLGPEIVLSGNGYSVEYAFLLLNASGVTIRGFVISHFLYGIQIYGRGSHGNRISGCYIGTDAAAAGKAGNYNGIEIVSGAHDNRVGGTAPEDRNVVSGNEHVGIRLSDAHRNVVVGNTVGLDRTAARALPNYDGVCVEGRSRGNRIGGTGPGERNVISGNVAYGVDLFGWGVQENVVLGNYIGTDRTGRRAVPNTYGVLFDDRASRNVVGGLGEGEWNLISGNTAFGAYFYNAGTNSNVVIGNRIGTDASGSRAVPNETGVHIDGGTFENRVERNLVSGNVVGGVTIFALHTDRNRIAGNRIGTDAGGTRPLGNGGDGIRIAFGPRQNLIGGSPEEANTIAFNGKNGVSVESDGAVSNRISCNSIYRNGNLGIDLFPEGANADDPGDGDAGPNAGMNRPAISTLTCGGGTCVVRGTVDTPDPQTVTVEVFEAAVNEAGHAQGRKYLGKTRPDSSGRWIFEAAVEEAVQAVTATATDGSGNTSEFSRAVTAP